MSAIKGMIADGELTMHTMFRYLISLCAAVLFCPMVAFGRDSLVVKHSSDTLIVIYNTAGDEDELHQHKYYTKFRPFIVGADKDRSGGRVDRVLADTVINGYRVNILGGWPCDTLYRHHIYAEVLVLPVDTTQVERWQVFSIAKRDNIDLVMRWYKYYYQGRETLRHNEVLDRMRACLNNFKARTHTSAAIFFIGKGGIVRSYRMSLSKGLYDANKPSNYVKLIESLNADTPFVDWQTMNPEDTLPAVYRHYVIPAYMVDGSFVSPFRSEK